MSIYVDSEHIFYIDMREREREPLLHVAVCLQTTIIVRSQHHKGSHSVDDSLKAKWKEYLDK
jgi:hypothetical protein